MQPNVLVVDDSLSVRKDLEQALVSAGFSVTACDSGATARKALRSGSYALLILDVLLPDASGLEIAQEARAYPPTAKAPIIMISTEADVQHRIRGLTAGASEYIGKPYGRQYLIKRARQLTDMRHASGPHSNSGAGPLRILLVDDSPTFLNALADSLREQGHDAILASSGSEALSFLSVQPVDGIVLDVFMPGISGLETCRRIRSTPAWADIPVMMLTGREDSVAKSMGIRAGVDEYIVKSNDVAAMTSRLSDLIRKRRLERGANRTSASIPPPRLPDAAPVSSRVPVFHERPSSPGRSPDSPPISSRTPFVMDRAAADRSPDSGPISSRPSSPPATPRRVPRAPDSSRESASSPLFDQVIALSGLPVFIGRSSLKRSLERAGVDVASLMPESLWKALPEIRQTLGVFLPAPEADRHLAAISSLARRPPS